ncbi:MAG: EAL domain-containing protein [Hyphomicrobiales bacterium]|nr:EAL domain-containing protein [Hyphomicrobiales bacterium]
MPANPDAAVEHRAETPLETLARASSAAHQAVIRQEAEIAALTQSLKKLIDLVPDNLWIKDAESRFAVANDATARQIGLASSGDLIGKTDLELHPPETAQKYYADEQRVVRTGEPLIDFEEYVLAPGGAKVWMTTTKVPLRDDDGKVVGIVGISRDITARKLAETLRDGQAQILEMIATGAPLTDILGRLIRLIESQMSGVKSSIMLIDETGVRRRHGAAPNLPEACLKAIEGLGAGPLARSCGAAALSRERIIVTDVAIDPEWADHRELAAAEEIRSCWSAPILSQEAQVLGALALYCAEPREPSKAEIGLIDVAAKIAGIAIERKLVEDRIQFMATHDALTGLPNRALLKDRLTQAVLMAERYDRWATVAFIDLDNFKYVNDSLGHNAGDELLKAVARRMVGCVRSTDTVVRLGGDEFVVVLADQPSSMEAITETLRRLTCAIAEPIRIGRHVFCVTGSLGVASFPNDGKDADALLARADAAMYRAKENGRNNFQFYRPEINRNVQEKFRMQEALRLALAREEFVLYYQPQVSLRSGAVLAVEALIRWRHPALGLLAPARFIPIAEETGLIAPIGEWVLNEACRQATAWQRAGLPPVRVCVNVSARQFMEEGLAAFVAAALRNSGLRAELLELEITESLIMQDVDRAVATMQELERLGVQLSIDDFGTGYSSLAALKTFPVARLKIDKAFIQGLPGDENDMAVAAAVISLGQKLNLKVIAEGVETADQVAFLRDNHCDEIQGYHLSKPIPPEELETFLRQWAQRGEPLSP